MRKGLPQFILKWLAKCSDEQLRDLNEAVDLEGIRRGFGPHWQE